MKMKKKVILASLLAGAIILSSVGNLYNPLYASAESTVSGGDTSQETTKKLDKTKVTLDKENPGIIHWTPVEGADHYKITIRCLGESYNGAPPAGVYSPVAMTVEKEVTNVDLAWYFSRMAGLRSSGADISVMAISDSEDVESSNSKSYGYGYGYDGIFKSMKVNFETNGGTDIPQKTAYHNMALLNDRVVRDVVTTREGYEFKGWYLDEALQDNSGIYYGEAVDIDTSTIPMPNNASDFFIKNSATPERLAYLPEGAILLEALYKPEITLYAKWEKIGTEETGTEETGTEENSTEETGAKDSGTEETGAEETGTKETGTGEKNQSTSIGLGEDSEDGATEQEEVVLPSEAGTNRIMSTQADGSVEVEEKNDSDGSSVLTVQGASGSLNVTTYNREANAVIDIPAGVSIKAADGSVITIKAENLRTYIEPVKVAADMKAKITKPVNAGEKGLTVNGTDPYILNLTLTNNNALINELTGGITFTVSIPESANVDFNKPVAVVRVHDGVPEFLDTSVNAAERKVTFTTDRFSFYAVTNVTVESPKTGEESSSDILLLIVVFSAVSGIWFFGKKLLIKNK